MPIIYSDLSDIINKVQWDVYLNDNVTFVTSFYYTKYPERKPIYSSEDSGVSEAVVTIDNIITMCNTDIPFSIKRNSDLVSICGYLTEYTNILSKNIEGLNPTHFHVRYYNKCKVALNTLEKMNDHLVKLEEQNRTFKPNLQLVDLLKIL